MSLSSKQLLIATGVFCVLGLIFLWNRPSVAPIEKRIIGPSGVKIIAFGDSLTAGYGLVPEDSYPALLQKALTEQGIKVTIKNEGISGETTAENLARAASIRAQNPDMVLLGIGGNDALRRMPLQETQENIESTIEILQSGENPPVVVLLQMQAPPTSGISYMQSFNDLYKEMAKTYRLPLVPFVSAELFLRSEYKLDAIHYNRAGYTEVVHRYVLPVVVESIEAMVR